jgi:hypothetical protein
MHGQLKVYADRYVPPMELVRREAYRLWEEADCPQGKSDFFWYEAERRLKLKTGIIPPKYVVGDGYFLIPDTGEK